MAEELTQEKIREAILNRFKDLFEEAVPYAVRQTDVLAAINESGSAASCIYECATQAGFDVGYQLGTAVEDIKKDLREKNLLRDQAPWKFE